MDEKRAAHTGNVRPHRNTRVVIISEHSEKTKIEKNPKFKDQLLDIAAFVLDEPGARGEAAAQAGRQLAA